MAMGRAAWRLAPSLRAEGGNEHALQLLVGVVDAQLLEAVGRLSEVLEAEDVE